MAQLGVEAMAYLAAMTTGWDEDTVQAYALELDRLQDDIALMEAVQKVARTWEKMSRPPLAIVVDAYHHELAVRVAEQREQLARYASERCDGYGWIDSADGMSSRPCPTCSPALHHIWNEPGAVKRFARGESLRRLLSIGDDELRDKWSRPTCPKPWRELDDDDAPAFVSVERGRQIAALEYMATYGEMSPSARRILHSVGAGAPTPAPARPSMFEQPAPAAPVEHWPTDDEFPGEEVEVVDPADLDPVVDEP